MIPHSWLAAIMKLTPAASALLLGGLLVSCDEGPESGTEAGGDFDLPGRDRVRVETHLTRPDETIRSFEPGHGGGPDDHRSLPGGGPDAADRRDPVPGGKAIP